MQNKMSSGSQYPPVYDFLMFFDVLLTSSRGALELQGRAAPTHADDIWRTITES